jgi:hypothetical protein
MWLARQSSSGPADGCGGGNFVRHGDPDEAARGVHRAVGGDCFCRNVYSQKGNFRRPKIPAGRCVRRGDCSAVRFVLPDSLAGGSDRQFLVLDGSICAAICLHHGCNRSARQASARFLSTISTRRFRISRCCGWFPWPGWQPSGSMSGWADCGCGCWGSPWRRRRRCSPDFIFVRIISC